MKQKILTLFLALAASVGTMFAEVVKIGDLYYDLDVVNKNASVAPNPNGKYSGDLIIPPTVEDNNSIVYNVTSILEGAFLACTELTGVTIPNSVTNIYTMAFQDCTSLTDIIIPEGVTAISDQVFFNCSGLTSVTLPKSLTVIGQLAFSYCTSLTDIMIPEGVTELSHSIFAQCSALTSVTIPGSVTLIMDYAFSGCSNLTGITCQAVVPPTCGEQVFGNVPKTIPVYVPKGSVAAYKAAGQWADFGDNIVPFPEEIYAVWDEPNTTLTLYYNDQRIALNGETDWSSHKDAATTVVLDASMQDARPKSTAKWFFTFSKMTAIQNLEYLNTSEVTEMTAMFLNCSALTALDLSKFNTENVTNMNGMFYACSSLTSLDLSNFNTAKVEDMSYMFYVCSSLTSLDLSNFNTANVTNMNYMFYYCTLLTSLDLSNFNTAKVTEMSGMFEGCKSLKTIYCDDVWNPSWSDNMFYDCTALVGGKGTAYNSDKFDKTYARPDGLGDQPGYFTAKGAGSKEIYAALSGSTMTIYYDDQKASRPGVLDKWSPEGGVNMDDATRNLITKAVIDASMVDARPTSTAKWFFTFSKMTAIQNLEYLNTSEVTEMSAMFLGCSALTALDLSKFNTENVTNMNGMFYACSSLTSLDLSNFNTAKVEDMSYMFRSCRSQTSLDVSSFNTANVTNMNYMFYYCYLLTSLDLSNFNTAKVTGMSGMFEGCESLKTIYCDDTWNPSSSDNMFYNCTALVGGKGTAYNSDKLDKTYARPDGLGDQPGYFTAKGAGSKEIYAALSGSTMTLYYDDQKASHSDLLENWNPEEGAYNVPEETRDLITKAVIDASMVDARPTSTKCWFYNLINMTTIEGLANLNTSEVTDMVYMFAYCTSLTSVDVSNFNTDNVTNMGGMFDDCSSLTSLDVSNFNTANVTNMYAMFYDCSSLTSLDVSNFNTANVTDMRYMFYDCSSLTSLDLSGFNTDKVENMVFMFYDCSSLTSLDVSSFNTAKVEYMNTMFFGCNSLTSLDVSNFNTANVTSMFDMFAYCNSLTSLDVSNFNTANVTDMSGMFEGCESLTTIYCNDAWNPSSSDNMFNGCTALVGGKGTKYDDSKKDKTYARPDGLDDQPGYFTTKNEGKCGENVYWVLKDGVLTISGTGPMYDFENYFTVPWDSEYTSIISVVVEDGVTSIGDWAFAYTNSLKSVTLPNSITTIGIAAFMTTNLTSVAIPNSVTTIRAGAFRYCTNLSSITLPNTIKSIANMTFDMCISLTSVTIPGSVENLGNQVFSGCTALTEITCEATTPPTCGTNVFEGVTNTIPVYVPAGSVDAYRTADGWNYFENIQAKGAGSKEIYAALSGSTMTIYYDDQKASRPGVLEEWNVDQGSENVPAAKRNLITTAVINPSMKKIHPTSNYFWFGNLVKMTNIEGMENLNTSEVVTMLAMFSNCISLTDLDLSSFNTAKVKDMSYMFYNCSSLTSLDISSFNTVNVESMYNMFYSCYSLKTIYCNENWSTRSVEDDEMFFGCTSLAGGNGTEYDAGKVDKSYARPDGLDDQPGYFTAKSAPITPEEQKEIDAVIDLINAIGSPITLQSESAIVAARTAYDALTDVQKALVTNYSVLTDAEQAYTKLKEVEIAKEQLKNIISEANQLKAAALIYAPTAVTDIDAIINDAQSTIDDPKATVDQVNAKAATLTDNLHTLAVNLLDQAKEQLKQSIIALFLPGDYPSWYDAVITPALNQVDGVTWDFNKSVNENIVFFQATGTQIYNDTKSALEALRAGDTRSIVTACAFTGFENGIKVDMTWNISALNNLINTLNASVAAEPYRLDVEMSSLGKWDPINATLVVLDPYAEEKLTAGDYQFITAVRIDGEDAKQYRLPKATEEALSVSVDAAVWSVDLTGIVIDATYSYTYVTSPMFTISKSEDVELINEDQLKTQKIFRDGHIYILRGDHIFDIRGTMVK